MSPPVKPAGKPGKQPSSTTRTLVRGLNLLELIARSNEGLALSELAAGASLDKATTLRLIGTLREAGWVRQDPSDRRYRVTGKMAHLSQIRGDGLSIQVLARPHLTRLRDEVNETVHLGVIRDDAVVYIEKLESSNSIRLVSTVGQEMPILTTALGRAILSALPEPERAVRIGALPLAKRTPQTMDKKQLLPELVASAERGYAIDHEENELGVTCVGAPLFDSTGAPAAAISISGPTFRVAARLDLIGRACSDTAAAISRDFGAVVVSSASTEGERGK
jgi:IclR family transcriptional regulator, KDG regulon repressor